MERTTVLKKNEEQTTLLHNTIIESIEDKKGESIVSIDLKAIPEAISDYFIICEADNMPQVRAISEHIQFNVKQKTGEYAIHSEGENNLEWVLIDYFDIVVHVFYKEKREFYNIEALWSDGIIKSY